jgi:CBS domain-containing protein
VNDSHLDRTDRPLRDLGHPVRAKVEPNATLHDTLEAMLTSMAGCACVIDKRGSLQGVVEIEALTDVIRRLRANARKHYEDENGQSQPTGTPS